MCYVYVPKVDENKLKQFIAERVARRLLEECEGPSFSTLISTLAEDRIRNLVKLAA